MAFDATVRAKFDHELDSSEFNNTQDIALIHRGSDYIDQACTEVSLQQKKPH